MKIKIWALAVAVCLLAVFGVYAAINPSVIGVKKTLAYEGASMEVPPLVFEKMWFYNDGNSIEIKLAEGSKIGVADIGSCVYDVLDGEDFVADMHEDEANNSIVIETKNVKGVISFTAEYTYDGKDYSTTCYAVNNFEEDYYVANVPEEGNIEFNPVVEKVTGFKPFVINIFINLPFINNSEEPVGLNDLNLEAIDVLDGETMQPISEEVCEYKVYGNQYVEFFPKKACTIKLIAKVNDDIFKDMDITVTGNPVADITLSESTSALKVGDELNLSATITGEDPQEEVSNPELKWDVLNTQTGEYNDDSVCSLEITDNENVVVKAVALGECQIIATNIYGEPVQGTCNVTVKGGDAVRVIIDRDQAQITMADTLKLSASIKPDFASQLVAWKAVDAEGYESTVVSVDTEGNVTPLAIGTAYVQAVCAENPEIKDVCEVTVSDVDPEGIEISRTSLTLKAGEKFKLFATVYPEKLVNKNLVWESSDKTGVYVGQSGQVSAIYPGEYTITVKTKAEPVKEATCAVKVLDEELLNVELAGVPEEFYVGDKAQASLVFTPDNVKVKSAKWSSSDKNILYVGGSGQLLGEGIGTATLTVVPEATGEPITVDIQVKEYVSGMIRIEGDSSIKTGESKTLTVSYGDEPMTYPAVIWTSSNKNGLYVKGGVITASIPGIYTITATNYKHPELYDSFTVTVESGVEDVLLSEYKKTAQVGDSFTLTATVLPEKSLISSRVIWSWIAGDQETDPKGIYISAGKVKVYKPGVYNITATSAENPNASATCVLTVPEIMAEKIIFSDEYFLGIEMITVHVGETIQINPVFDPIDTYNKTLVYKYGNGYTKSDIYIGTAGKIKAYKEGMYAVIVEYPRNPVLKTYIIINAEKAETIEPGSDVPSSSDGPGSDLDL
ncbi:MAG: Ig-like domain-containing protein [Armatimonadetes bacterium]|nr:Ig-like domain-containing protein [Candidatus Hippobium faecium]